MFESFFADIYWTGVINSVSKLPKEVVIGVAATLGIVHMHKNHCDSKTKVAEYEARKAEADLEALKIKTFTVE